MNITCFRNLIFLVGAVIPSLTAISNPQTPHELDNYKRSPLAGCIRALEEQPPNPIRFQNSCPENMEFTLEWVDSVSSSKITYRIGGNKNRDVRRHSSKWQFVGEAPAEFGSGPKGDVSVVQQATTVQDLYRLLLHNAHHSYTIVHSELKMYFNPPPQYGKKYATFTRDLVLGPNEEVACCFFDKTVFDRYEVEIKSEDDAD